MRARVRERVLCTPLTASGASEVRLACVGTEMGRGHLTILSFWFCHDFILNSFGFLICLSKQMYSKPKFDDAKVFKHNVPHNLAFYRI